LKSNKDKGTKSDLEAKKKELISNYIPIDFDAYSIEDKNMVLNKQSPLND
jgi:hypothetical protein